MDSCYNLYNNIYMQHFLDNEEERNVSELEDDSEVSKLNSGSESHSDDEPYHWDSAASTSSPKYAEPTSLACTSTRSLKVNNYYYNCCCCYA